MFEKYKPTIIILSVIALIAAGIVNYVKDLMDEPQEAAPEYLQVKAPTEKILHSQKIKDEQGNDIVKYLYASETEVPAKTITADNQEIQEDISKRTKNAQFFKKRGLHSPEGLWSQDADTQEGSTASLRSDYGADGEKDDGAVAASDSEKEVWVGRFYAGEPFYKDAAENKWYQTEIATTTAEEFSRQTKPNFLAKLKAFFNMNVLADTGSYYAGAGDGRVGFINQPYWDTVHNSTIGGSISYTIATAVVKSEDIGDSVAHAYGIFRMFIPIDTSGIDDSAIISTAKLYLYCTAKSSGDNDGDDWINVVQTSQVSNSSLVTEDYDQCGAIHSAEEGCDTRIDISSASTATWWNWALNTTGKSWVNKTGWTKLGLREGHDILDFPIAVDYAVNSVTFSMSEQTGTAQDPYLEVTWVVPPTIVTNPASLVASTVATGNGNITDIGTATVTERGFKYGLTETDTWSVSETGGFSAGVFKLEIPNLTPGATYHIRAFATSADGTGYGSYVSFITLTEQTGSPIIFKRNTILKENVILK